MDEEVSNIIAGRQDETSMTGRKCCPRGDLDMANERENEGMKRGH